MVSLPTLRIIRTDKRIRCEETLRLEVIDRAKRHLVVGQRSEDKGNVGNLLLLGKVIEEGSLSFNYSNYNVWLDITRPHVGFVCGKRGEGKSYDLGVILEALTGARQCKITTREKAVSTIVFDTQDQFWTMNYTLSEKDPEDKRQLKQLSKWGLQQGRLQVEVFVPARISKLSPQFRHFSLNPSELGPSDWCGLFGLSSFEPMGHLILLAYNKVTKDGYVSVKMDPETKEVVEQERIEPNKNYSIDDLRKCVLTDIEITNPQTGFSRVTQRAVVSRLDWSKEIPIFGDKPLNINEILRPNQISIIELRQLDDSTKSLIVGVITKKVFDIMGRVHRIKQMEKRLKLELEKARDRHAIEHELEELRQKVSLDVPEQAWLIIDEAHVMCPSTGYTAAKHYLIEYVKRGRDSGLSLFFASQQPSAIASKLLSQLDLMIVHSLATTKDISAAKDNAVSRVPERIKIGRTEITSNTFEALIRNLKRGEAIFIDHTIDRAFTIKIRPRITPHGGAEPKLSAG